MLKIHSLNLCFCVSGGIAAKYFIVPLAQKEKNKINSYCTFYIKDQ